MAENKKSFLLYCDLIHTIKKMPKDKAGELFLHILEYVNDENPKSEDLIINLTFEPIKQQLKRDLIKYEALREKNRLSARKRWDASAYKPMPNDAKNADSVTDTVNDTVTDNVLLKKETKNIFSFKKSLEDLGAEKKLIDEWCSVRKAKKAVNTETALKKFKNEIEKSGKNINEILQICVERSWSGFQIEWLKNNKNNGEQPTKTERTVNAISELIASREGNNTGS